MCFDVDTAPPALERKRQALVLEHRIRKHYDVRTWRVYIGKRIVLGLYDVAGENGTRVRPRRTIQPNRAFCSIAAPPSLAIDEAGREAIMNQQNVLRTCPHIRMIVASTHPGGY